MTRVRAKAQIIQYFCWLEVWIRKEMSRRRSAKIATDVQREMRTDADGHKKVTGMPLNTPINNTNKWFLCKMVYRTMIISWSIVVCSLRDD
mmetsp:Transcript_2809/g.6143  ORF Transcript_2809/g.6143 Transcript_2809/m.6143 type:complete len:91 (+) Transcript_2809:1400-1672(+)